MSSQMASSPTQDPTDQLTAATAALAGIADNIEKVIRGKRDVIELVLLCLVAEGHLLVEDVPGVGKTSLAKALAKSLDVSFGRIQFTPDLLPSDVTGVTVYDQAHGEFSFHPGPIFHSVVLADEINRASPKTQSALLEAMAEEQVTVDGVTYPLRRPFVVIATQNPIEHEGTYALPESQLDRFLMRVGIGYPSPEAELDLLENQADSPALAELGPVADASELLSLVKAASSVHVAPALRRYLVDLADASRRHPDLGLGMSPRATLSLLRVSRVRALSAGRAFATPDDVKALVRPVLAHRLTTSGDARLRGVSTEDVLAELIDTVPVPRAR
jgi:MoxR-like ATPase